MHSAALITFCNTQRKCWHAVSATRAPAITSMASWRATMQRWENAREEVVEEVRKKVEESGKGKSCSSWRSIDACKLISQWKLFNSINSLCEERKREREYETTKRILLTLLWGEKECELAQKMDWQSGQTDQHSGWPAGYGLAYLPHTCQGAGIHLLWPPNRCSS